MKIIKYLIIILLSYVGISLILARLLISNANINTFYLQSFIHESNNHNLIISSIEGDWRGIYPSLKIQLKNKTEKKNVSYPKYIELKVNIYKSIVYLKPVIKSVFVENIYYKNSLTNILKKIELDGKIKKYIIENIEIKDSTFSIEHDGENYNLKRTNITVRDNKIFAETLVDKNKKLILKIKNFEIEKNNLINFNYQIKLKGTFDYKIKNILKKYNINIKNSDLQLSASGIVKGNNFVNNKFNLNTKKNSHIEINKNIFKNINAKFIFEGNFTNKLNFEIINLSFISKNDNFYEVNNFASILNFNSNKINVFADSIFINTSNIISDFNFFTNADFDFSGTINNFKLSLLLNNINNNYFFSGNLLKSNVSFSNGFIKGFSGYVEFDPLNTILSFNSNDTIISYNSVIRENLIFDSIKGTINIKNYKNPKLNITSLFLKNDDINMTISGSIDNDKDSIKLYSNIDYVDMRNITKYMPLSFMKNSSSQWFQKSFIKGYSKEAHILINGNLSDYPFYENLSGISFAIFPISNLDVDYKKNWIPFKNVNGKAYFNKNKAYFISEEINILDTKLNKSSLYINEVRSPELRIKGVLTGPFSDLLKFTNEAKLTNVSKNKVNSINGNSETTFKMKLAFNGSKNRYESQIKLNNLEYKFDEKNKLSDLTGIINYKNEIFFTNKEDFIKGKYNQTKIKFSLNTDDKKNFLISGKQKISLQDYIENKTIKNRISGKSEWHYSIVVPSFESNNKKIKIRASSNLLGSKIEFPEPFKKESKLKNNLIINTYYADNNFTDIKIRYKKIVSEFKSLNNITGYINFSGEEIQIPDNKINLVGKIKYFDLSQWKNIGDNSGERNYLNLLNKIDLNFLTFKNGDIVLDNFYVNGFDDKKNFVFNKIVVDSSKVKITASGKVEPNNITNFKINIKSNNVENLLNYWNFKHGLRKSSINSNINISWKGGLFDYELQKVYGEFTTNMKEGRIKKVGNRAIRIFGLFNMDLLVKRLSLDFDDVTKNGFFYNSLNGNFRIENGDIFTTDMIIKGPSAELLTVGTTNIINETYDMQVIASPEFGETLPAIALIGGPITAAATYAAEKLAKAFGKDINDLIKIKYKVSGTWDDPVIKIIDKRKGVLDDIEDLFK